jgi:uncharacterized membrane protein YphA (DoxX/SURF4 family)
MYYARVVSCGAVPAVGLTALGRIQAASGQSAVPFGSPATMLAWTTGGNMRIVRLAGTIGLWALQVLAGALFALIGTGKFADPTWQRHFVRWGYPDGFYMVVGVLEALGGLMLLVPRLTSYAAAMLGIIMIGASLTHLVHGEMRRVAPPLVYLVVLAIVGIARRHAAIRSASIRPPATEARADVS